MSKRNNLSGQQFGMLTVLEFSHKDTRSNAYWRCRCSCGELTIVQGSNLKSGCTVSCGCYRKARLVTHGMAGSSIYKAWDSMLHRCTNPNNKRYRDYGGRGIEVCDSWFKFENFYADMGPRPTAKHSIDRIDNNGPYCKENCRWATPTEQGANQRSNRMLTHEGITLTVAQWSQRVSLSRSVIWMRLSRGWSVERALTQPVKQKRSK